MTTFYDMVYREREVSAPVDYERGFLGCETCGMDAPQIIAAGSTMAIDGTDGPFHVTSFHFRGGF